MAAVMLALSLVAGGSVKSVLDGRSVLRSFFPFGEKKRKTLLPLAATASTENCSRLLPFGDTIVLCPCRHWVPNGNLYMVIWHESWNGTKQKMEQTTARDFEVGAGIAGDHSTLSHSMH